MTDPTPDPVPRGRPRLTVGLIAAIAMILIFAALRAMAPVVVPVVLAVFVTLAVLPLDQRLAARLPGRLTWLGRAAVMAMLVAGLTLFLGGLAFAVTEIATNLPDVSQALGDMLPPPRAEGALADTVATLREALRGQAASLTERFVGFATDLAQTIAGATGGALAAMVLVLFLILLALSEARSWAGKLEVLSGPRAVHWQRVGATLGQALRRFIVTRALVGAISTVTYTLWLLPFDLDLLAVWAILVFLMNFIPNIGALVSGVFPTLYAFLTKDFGTALLIGVGLIVIEQVIGYWVDPRLQGNRTALSPVMILIAVVFWGWLWGVAGAFLGTPMTLAIMIVCNAVGPLRPVALVLSNQAHHDDLDRALAR